MSRKGAKSQASSARAASGAFGGAFSHGQEPFRSGQTTFGGVPSSTLSYVYEPPNLGGISDPNVIVAFKNVQKRDSTTKTKALEDLQSHFDSPEGNSVEEGILDAWIKVYPRTSIDSARRVRQLAHTLQGRIAIKCGKRLAKHMPDIVSSWLAGRQDLDKAVSRAAHESFNQVFATEEKSNNVWRVYHEAILEYSENVVVSETESTLSDMKTTSLDDATSKYARVVGCAVGVLSSLIEKLAQVDMEKPRSILPTLIKEEALWRLANHDDAFVRRSILRLLVACLDKLPMMLSSPILSTYFIEKGLHNNQRGSSLDFVRAIERLSEIIPTAWTSAYDGVGKKSASNRLLQFLRKGSQGGPADFWSHITQLLKLVPQEIFLTYSSGSNAEQGQKDSDPTKLPVLEAIRTGINSKDEPQSNAILAWNSYLDVCEFIISSEKEFAHSTFMQDHLFPLIYQYIRPSPAPSHWAIAGSQQEATCIKTCELALRINSQIFCSEWLIISSQLVEDVKTSLPEQSKDYVKSQDLVAAQTLKWYRLQGSLIGSSSSEQFRQTVYQTLVQEITSFISVLRTRNGKPYGAAAALQTLMQIMPNLVLNETSAKDDLVNFAENEVPRLMTSRSATYLVRVLDAMADYMDISSVYMSCLESIESSLASAAGQATIVTLLSSPGIAKAGLLSTKVNKTLARATENVLLENDELDWSILIAALQNQYAPKELTDQILSILTSGLSIETSNQASLRGLDIATKHNRNALRNFTASSHGSGLVAKLLFLSEQPDTAQAHIAKDLIKEIESVLGTAENDAGNIKPILSALQNNFRAAGAESLSIESLVGQAERHLKQCRGIDLPSAIAELLPMPSDWELAFAPFIKRTVNASLAMTNPFGAAITMIQSDPSEVAPALPRPVARDQDGRSVLLRIVQYVTKLVKATKLLSQVSEEQALALFHCIALSVQLAGDNISISGAMPLWTAEDPQIEIETSDFIFEAQNLLVEMLQTTPMSGLSPQIFARFLQESEGSSSSSYYNARAYLTAIDEVNELNQQKLEVNSAHRIKGIHKSSNLFADMSVLISCDKKDAIRPCNEVLSHLTDQVFETENSESQTTGLRRLLLMNCLLQRSDEIVHDIPKQRLIFFVQHAIGQIRTASFEVFTEINRSLNLILPAIKDIYGSFWGEALDSAKIVRKHPLDDAHMLGYYSFFKLCATLAKPNMLEANDDLLDAWTDRKLSIMQAAIGLLEEASAVPDEAHHPRRIFNELLSRLLEGSGQMFREEMETLFPVLASESVILQRRAFELLHEQIPQKQEQLSLDKALTKDYEVKIPEELLSLVLVVPREPELSEPLQYRMPTSVRSYLLSWILIFDHWRNASNVVQIDYATSLAEGTYLNELLDFTFTILIDSRGQAVDISKFDITAYHIEVESVERDTHWLLSHLYFLCLKHLPTLSKSWWRDTTNRQTNIIVEAWTQKYVSKHIIASELDTVREWGPTQITGDQPLTVKVLSSACEISASIPVDEESMVIAIRLPPSYPLARAEVEGLRRVGVSEKKWVSWIRNTQGQLTIASEGGANALIDCLLAWRKNVTATMKGQTECAICYSVVGVDRSLPSKVCKTCKNKFHGSCLFRWFSSSNSSSCPLCRNTFTYS